MARAEERGTAIDNELIFIELEWAEVPDEQADALLADERLAFCRHYLASARRYRPHLLSEPEERILSDKSLTANSAWVRLFSELTSAITVTIPIDGDATEVSLEQGLSQLMSPERDVRRTAAEAVTVGLEPGLRTRAFVFNTLLVDKATDDRLRSYPSWIASRNLANEASDESVQALVDAVQSRYDIPQRWYALKAQLLGLDRIADYDRMASVASSDEEFGWDEARHARARRVRVVLARPGVGRRAVLRRVVDRRADAARASARARSARTRCRASTRTCCSTGPLAAATCSRSPTRWATGCTRTWRASRASSTRPRRSRWPRPRRCSARRSRSVACSTPPTIPRRAWRCWPRASRARSPPCSARWR